MATFEREAEQLMSEEDLATLVEFMVTREQNVGLFAMGIRT
jgi:hypothetical protein